MFTYELQRRLATHGTIVSAAANPGISSTELARTPRSPPVSAQLARAGDPPANQRLLCGQASQAGQE